MIPNDRHYLGVCGYAPTGNFGLPLTLDPIIYNKVDHSISPLCGSTSTPVTTTWIGRPCGQHGTDIQWLLMTTHEKGLCATPNTMWWLYQPGWDYATHWLGSCGTVPANVALPTKVNYVTYELKHTIGALCGGPEEATSVFFGAPCASNPAVIQWDTIETTHIAPSSGCTAITHGSLYWKRGPAGMVDFLGNCGTPPSLIPDLPMYIAHPDVSTNDDGAVVH